MVANRGTRGSPSSTLSIRQFSAGGTFALIRFDFHSGATFWMKATGEPNRHEFCVTRKLAQVCPEFLPPRIAEREDWNAWLMEDASESLLNPGDRPESSWLFVP